MADIDGLADPAGPLDPAERGRYERGRRRATALYDLSTLITSTLEIDPIVELLLTQARHEFGADLAAVFLKGALGELRCINAVGLSRHYLAAVNYFYEQAAGGLAAALKQTVYVPDAQTDPVMGPLRSGAAR